MTAAVLLYLISAGYVATSTGPQLHEWQEHSQLLARYYIDVGRDKGRPLTVELNSGAGHLLAALRGSQPRSV